MLAAYAGAYGLNDIGELVNRMIAHTLEQIENPALRDSGFVFEEVIGTNIDFHRLNLTRGSSYLPLPDWLSRKKAIINPKNSDMECFKWAVIVADRWEEIDKHPERISKLRKFEEEYDWSDVEYPFAIRSIDKFERKNEISVNVLAVEDKRIYICRKSTLNYKRVVNLMLINGENSFPSESGKFSRKHYIAFKSLSRLLVKKNTKHESVQYHCTNCLHGFPSEISRDKQESYCKVNEAVRIEMPTRKSYVRYSKGQYQLKAPFVMYADFESLLTKTFEEGIMNVHVPLGWCVIKSEFAHKEVSTPIKTYKSKDCFEKFCEHMVSEAKRLHGSFPELPMKPMTKVQKRESARASVFHICLSPFKLHDRKVRDHCHYTGEYRGASHSSCNLQYKVPSYIPVIFHNLSRYDAHLFIRELSKHTNRMEVIAKNKEDYISFSIKVKVGTRADKESIEIDLRFIDSFRFMSSSLDSLVNNLSRGGHKFKGFMGYTRKQRSLLVRKGVYPYEYMDSWEKFREKRLPSIGKFYSKLNMSGISDEDYSHAERVWKEFELRDLGEYHDLYLKMDVILLSNVLEKFREVCMENCKLDPAHFYTAPGLAWQVCLKKTEVKLDLITDPDMLLMFEKGIRGGITQVVKRYARANNKYMNDYDRKEPSKYLQYLDANNLYGWVMSQPLPTGGFKWVDVEPEEVKELSVRKDREYLMEVDVLYPRELHNKHNDLPFMCDRMKIGNVEKLVADLYYKKRYVIHIRALQQVLDHGLISEKIHRMIEFKQSPWMKEYIVFYTKLRTAAKNDFEKDFYKLMNNAVFGKTMESIRKHRNIKLVNNEADYLKCVMKTNLKSGTLFGPDLMGCEMGKTVLKMNKPVYIGQAILDLSKTIMYEFHYDYMLPKYGNRISLCYMDTDSFIYDIKTEDFYEDISDDVESRFDTSCYSNDGSRPLPVGLNKKVIGLMKDEFGGDIMREFVALRPKMYAYKVESKEFKRYRGIKKCVVKKDVKFEDYKRCLMTGEMEYRSQTMFRSRLHEIMTIEVNKLALRREDDKRIYVDNTNSLARGHWKTRITREEIWGKKR